MYLVFVCSVPYTPPSVIRDRHNPAQRSAGAASSLITRREAAQVLVLWKLAGKKVGSISRHVESAFNHAGRNVPWQLLSFWQVSFFEGACFARGYNQACSVEAGPGHERPDSCFCGCREEEGQWSLRIAPFQRVKRTMICKRAMARLQAEGKVQVSPKA